MIAPSAVPAFGHPPQERTMAKSEKKDTKKPAQKAAPKHSDSEIKDLNERDAKSDASKVKGGRFIPR
jgi:hypothetical protein